MIKRMLLLAGMALAALAYAAPAVAQEVTLTEEGTPLKEGAGVTGVSVNFATTGPNGTILCETVTFHFEVAKNGPLHLVLEPQGAIEFQGCKPIGGSLVTFEDATALEPLTIDTWGTGHVPATFLYGVAPSQCHYLGEMLVQGHSSGSDVLNLEPSVFVSEGIGCVQEVALEATFTLQTEDGTPLDLEFQETE